MDTAWERAETAKFPVLWYLCYDSSLAVLETRRKPKLAEKHTDKIMFEDVEEAANADDVVTTDKRVYYRMRLPYTEGALSRRQEFGRSVPDNWRVAVFEITTETEDHAA